jgi:hypothetical protein
VIRRQDPPATDCWPTEHRRVTASPTVRHMTTTHRARVEATLAQAAIRHAALLERLSPEMRATLPVDAQGLTEAIDLVAEAAGLSSAERRGLVQPHAVNPAVVHARVFGGAPLTEETLMGSFVEAARVRAGALADLAEIVGPAALGSEVRALLVECPLPLASEGLAGVPALRDAYAAHEHAVVAIAARLDEVAGG